MQQPPRNDLNGAETIISRFPADFEYLRVGCGMVVGGATARDIFNQMESVNDKIVRAGTNPQDNQVYVTYLRGQYQLLLASLWSTDFFDIQRARSEKQSFKKVEPVIDLRYQTFESAKQVVRSFLVTSAPFGYISCVYFVTGEKDVEEDRKDIRDWIHDDFCFWQNMKSDKIGEYTVRITFNDAVMRYRVEEEVRESDFP